MFFSRNKKNNVYPCKPHFYYIKVGFKGVKIISACFRDVLLTPDCPMLNSFTATGDNNRLFANSIDPDETAQ